MHWVQNPTVHSEWRFAHFKWFLWNLKLLCTKINIFFNLYLVMDRYIFCILLFSKWRCSVDFKNCWFWQMCVVNQLKEICSYNTRNSLRGCMCFTLSSLPQHLKWERIYLFIHLFIYLFIFNVLKSTCSNLICLLTRTSYPDLRGVVPWL